MDNHFENINSAAAGSKTRRISCREALREALREEMLRDDKVILLGEDIGRYGGGFSVTSGLLDEFGSGRVLETPISETAYVGAAIGAAVTGMRPVVELMFSDFMGVCWDQIMNEAAKMHFMYGGRIHVPMVIRTAAGAGTGAAAQHSQSLETMYCHVPGLKVVVPSTPADAKGLLKTAIRDENPVIFLEQKLLYDTEGEVPEGEYLIPLGKAALRRTGSDLTIITYGRMVQLCEEAAKTLQQEGISAEILDLRSLSPLDKDAVAASVSRTGRALIVHESVQFAGFGAEISAAIMESPAFYRLKAPVRRLGAAFCPIPSSPVLEADVLPSAATIAEAARALMQTFSGQTADSITQKG